MKLCRIKKRWLIAAVGLCTAIAVPGVVNAGEKAAKSTTSGAEFASIENHHDGGPSGMVLIPAGRYAPILRGKDEPETVEVAAYWLDERPVTNGEFLAYAPPERRTPRVSLRSLGDPEFFPIGVKHRSTR